MHENFKLPLTRQKKKIELGTISGIQQCGYACDRAKFAARIKNRTIHELCRRTRMLFFSFMTVRSHKQNNLLMSKQLERIYA